MGPNLLFHLGGGRGGIHPIAGVWRDLGVPDLTPELQKTIIDGVRKEVGSRSLEQIARERDEQLRTRNCTQTITSSNPHGFELEL